VIDPKDINGPNAAKCFGELLDAIPKGKRGAMFRQMATVEATLNRSLRLLDALRGYFLETTGEESPFVKKIDELLPRRLEG
jgi:hypothetical protein